MATFNKIRDIFYSGIHSFRGVNDSITEIAFLVDENYLSLTETLIASKKEYQNLLDNSNGINQLYEAAGGGNAHVVLKILAKKYLVSNRNCEVIFEHLFCGYYPDVISTDKTIVCECGQTGNPEKLLTYLKQENVKEFIQIPYPSYEDQEIKRYSFTIKNDLKDFLVFLEKEKLNRIKSQFFKKPKL